MWKKISLAIADFEDERELQSERCGWSPELGKGQTDSPLESSERNINSPVNSSLVKPSSDFWAP